MGDEGASRGAGVHLLEVFSVPVLPHNLHRLHLIAQHAASAAQQRDPRHRPPPLPPRNTLHVGHAEMHRPHRLQFQRRRNRDWGRQELCCVSRRGSARLACGVVNGERLRCCLRLVTALVVSRKAEGTSKLAVEKSKECP
eukprot:3271663-Rhodomonas_salina.2